MKSFGIVIHEDAVAELVFDHAERPVNVFDERSLTEMEAVVENLERDRHVKALIIRSAKSDFIVGADVEAIAAVADPVHGEAASRRGQLLFERIARLPWPTLAAVNGLCLGGGTELALSCRYRVAANSPATRIGLPEVQLGILPGWGGTQRLPRLIGLPAALDMILSGREADARGALYMGLADALLPAENFDEQALSWLRREVLAGHRPPRRLPAWRRMLVEGNPLGRFFIAEAARRAVMKRTDGQYPAPLAALRLAAESFSVPLEEGLKAEARAIGALIAGPVCKNILRLFFLREQARKGPARDVAPREIHRLGVLGAGVMGGGIAALAAKKGVEVRLRDLKEEAVQTALRTAWADMARVSRRRRPAERSARAMSRISPTLELSGFGHAELVIEAVVERMEVKQKVLQEMERRVPADCVLATNTSALSVAEMARALKHPERLVGLHFFNPVSKMPLVELVRPPGVSEEAAAAALAFARKLGKLPVEVKDSPGFLVNRLLAPYMQEAALMAEEGAPVEALDAAMRAFGMPMGPLALYDEVGLDVALHVAATMRSAWPQRFVESALLARLSSEGSLGRKTGRGFYVYKNGRKAGVSPSASVYAKGAAPSQAEMEARLLFPMLNEAARCLEEHVVADAGWLDFAMVMGTGFAPFRGGPMRWAEKEPGFARVVEGLERLAEKHGPRFAPSAALRAMA